MKLLALMLATMALSGCCSSTYPYGFHDRSSVYVVKAYKIFNEVFIYKTCKRCDEEIYGRKVSYDFYLENKDKLPKDGER